MGEIKDVLTSVPSPSNEIYYTTGCTLLDMVLGGAPGCYGLRGGVLTGIFGVNQAGKSFLMGETIAACYHSMPKFSWKYQDIERRFRFNTKQLYGFQVIPEEDDEKRCVETIEELDGDLGAWLDATKAPAIYVTDSLDALSNDAAEDASDARKSAWKSGKEVSDEATFGTSAAKFLSQSFFKTKMSAVAKSGIALVFLSQVRENVGNKGYGPKFKRAGGTALEHWCDTTLQLRVIHKILAGADDRVVGVVVEAKTTKSSTGRPFRSCRYTLYFDYGIDDIGSNLDFVFDLRTSEGKLGVAAEEVVWSGIPKSLTNLKQFLVAHDAYDRARKTRKAEGLRGNINVDWLLDWIPGQQDLASDYQVEFGGGITASREALITMIENDPEMKAELRQRTIDKWEANEAAIATHRKGKYT